VHHVEELHEVIDGILRHHAKRDLRALLIDADVPWGDVNSPAAVLEHRQLSRRGRWIDATLPGGQRVPVTANPVYFDGGVAHAGGDRVPELGESTEVILAELGYAADDISAFAARGVVALAPS